MLARKLQEAAGNAGGEALYVEDVFSTYLYTGNGSTQTITNGIDLNGEGGLVWIKNRDAIDSHVLTDTERGVGEILSSDATTAETTDSDTTTAFNSDGFSIGADVKVNTNTEDYASWTFRKAEKFFDVVTYTGNGTTGRQISHNLGSTPGFFVVKRTDTADNWKCWHTSTGDGVTLELDGSGGDTGENWPTGGFTSTYFTVNSGGSYNASGGTYVAYLFASDAGGFGDDSSESIIKCGGFTYGATGDIEINVGFEPQWALIKRADGTGNWWITDTQKGWCAQKTGGTFSSTTGGELQALWADLTNAEVAYNYGGLTSTGFKWASNFNAGNTEYIYIAIRRPMKTPTAGTEVFAPFTYDNSAGGFTQTQNVGFPTDIALEVDRVATSTRYTTSRLQGEKNQMGTQSYSPESDYYTYVDQQKYDLQNLFAQMNAITSSVLLYCFRRATKFSDVVGYIGNGVSNTTQTHNLGAVPEMMIIKARTAYQNWVVYHKDIGNTGVIVLNQDAASVSSSTYFNNTTPTSTIFTLGSSGTTNANTNPYIAYLFSTLAGVSKVGSYTGTGANLNVDCGFSTGARFILIKRTDSTGDWYVWDSARGITAGSDAYLLLNSTSPETTSTDYIDPLSSGFTVTSTAPAGLNASGGSYLFLAIA